MTAKATKTRSPNTRPATQSEAEFRRWSPEQVVEHQLLPYSSVRTLKERCYRRALWHHNDGGRITFTAEDLRRNSQLGAVEPQIA
ncbi:hypothetical protein [Streptomyces sp. SCL15-4]|uniref:hypothetical protein n=1 Tax=Streptomyces sp. SCL15-4 TaxID=2967221 RepID=UPI0029663FFC|nr:hypothetical protein [Streptomyces sp. SCL15-4]